jgi:GPI mannosyltransferase 3
MPRGLSQNRLLTGALIFVAGFLLRFLPLVLHYSLAQGDEIFQASEAAHRLVFGYGFLPWEFAYGARSWILGLLSAIPMAFAKQLGAGPELYLPLITAFFAGLGALTTLLVFLKARNFYGPAGAAAAAIAASCWIDNMYFGGRTLAEPLAAHFLILAVLVAGPGVIKPAHLALGGFLAGAALVTRIQIAPAIALLWVWPGITKQRLLLLSLGAIAALAGNAVLDILTWGEPFQPLWGTFKFNFLLHVAAQFGVSPWSEYFRFMAYNWGASAVPFLVLALLGARRMPIFLAMAAIILAAHMSIGHKEFRFIFPAIAMLSILAGFGLVEVTRLLAHGLEGDRRVPAPAWLCLIVGACWAGISLLNLIGRGYDQNWQRGSGYLAAELKLSRMPQVCGIAFDGRIAWTGGYTYLHRPIPIYSFQDTGRPAELAGAANVFVADKTILADPHSPYRRQECFGQKCIFLRPGPCKALPMPAPPTGPFDRSMADAQPFVVGVP